MPVHATAALAHPTLAAAEATAWDDALIRRYDTSGPRYTSYPTALSFHDQFHADDMSQALERSNASQKPLSLYVHVPCCRKICFY